MSFRENTKVDTVTLTDLFGPRGTGLLPEKLEQAIADALVRPQVHPTEPLTILNYTARCQFQQAWNDVTMTCRGLVYRSDTGVIVARSFPKFFNLGDPRAPQLDISTPAVVSDKLDGSLGICVPLPSGKYNGYTIATRGSFTSDQAIHATDILRTRYSDWEPPPGITILFEIIYSDNRIVVDYAGFDDLVFLGAVETATGISLPQNPAMYQWEGPAAHVFSYSTLGDALIAPPRENAEGLVIHFTDTDQRVKIKQADYVALHRVLTNTSSRTLWAYLAVNACKHLISKPEMWASILHLDPNRAQEILAVGTNWLDAIIESVPDEFYTWVTTTIDDMNGRVESLYTEICAQFVTAHEASLGDRRAFATEIADHPHKGAMYRLLDSQDITAYLWNSVYPPVGIPWMVTPEDTA